MPRESRRSETFRVRARCDKPSNTELRTKLHSPTVELLLYGLNQRRPNLLALNRSEEHTSELQSLRHLVCRLLLDKNVSRGRYDAQIYTNDKSELAPNLRREVSHHTAIQAGQQYELEIGQYFLLSAVRHDSAHLPGVAPYS